MRAGWLVVLAACGGSKSDKNGVAVELASVTLADDCGDYGYMPPPATPPPEAKERRQANEDVAAGAAARVNGDSLYRGCSQTAMQISFSADRETTVVIKKVELLDGQGKYIQDLTSRLPSRWDGRSYVKWDEKLEATKPLQASYALSAPNWEKLGGRVKGQTAKYHLHVVVAVGDREHSLDKQAIQPVVMQPDVVTMR